MEDLRHRVVARYDGRRVAGVLEAPPAMHAAIMGWIEAVLTETLEGEKAWAKSIVDMSQGKPNAEDFLSTFREMAEKGRGYERITRELASHLKLPVSQAGSRTLRAGRVRSILRPTRSSWSWSYSTWGTKRISILGRCIWWGQPSHGSKCGSIRRVVPWRSCCSGWIALAVPRTPAVPQDARTVAEAAFGGAASLAGREIRGLVLELCG